MTSDTDRVTFTISFNKTTWLAVQAALVIGFVAGMIRIGGTLHDAFCIN